MYIASGDGLWSIRSLALAATVSATTVDLESPNISTDG